MSQSSPNAEYVFKIWGPETREMAAGDFVLPLMEIDQADGYVHLSTRAQVEQTLSLHFAGKGAHFLMKIDVAQIADNLRWEPSRGGDLFPHLYADLPKAAILETANIEVAADGTMTKPDMLNDL